MNLGDAAAHWGRRAARLARWLSLAVGVSTVLLAFGLTCTLVMLQWLVADAPSISFAVAGGSASAVAVMVPLTRSVWRRILSRERAQWVETSARRYGFDEAVLFKSLQNDS